jgi:hypothetical protein
VGSVKLDEHKDLVEIRNDDRNCSITPGMSSFFYLCWD